MHDTMIRVLRWAHKGYTCSQILVLLALEARGEQNPALVRAAGGLAYGCGAGEGTCGVLTGGCCVLALFAGKGSDDEAASDRLVSMLQELSDWFSGHVGGRFGGITCQAVVGEDGTEGARQRCGEILSETYAKTVEILAANGFDI